MKLRSHLLALILLFSGCQYNDPDPLEPINRPIYYINTFFDELIFSPITQAYVYVTPSFIQTGVHNFVSNVNSIKTIPLHFLVGEWGKGFDNTARLTLNSTIGVLGLFDVASEFGLKDNPIDMNDVGKAYGIKPIYVVLPLMGPTTSFNLVTTIGQTALTNSVLSDDGRIALSVAQALDGRAQLLPFDELIKRQSDPYNYVRSMVMNQKKGHAEFELPDEA